MSVCFSIHTSLYSGPHYTSKVCEILKEMELGQSMGINTKHSAS